MRTKRLIILLIVSITILLSITIVFNKSKPFFFGLDILGGAQITYSIDTSKVSEKAEIKDRVAVLKNVIERRVNSIGISEANVYTKQVFPFISNRSLQFLVVELPGVTDIQEAIEKIGQTPFLEFKIFDKNVNSFVDADINGGHVTTASLQFRSTPTGAITNEPVVSLSFNSEGRKLFSTLTTANVGNRLGIFLDGEVISAPVIIQPIPGGTTQITGNFTLEEAISLVSSLNVGALPLPIKFEESQTISSEIGTETLDNSISVAILSFLFIISFMILIYRGVGVLASLSLVIYVIISITLWKVIPIVLTSAGIAGFILSIGFAVDANILIFERVREEIRNGKSFVSAINTGFSLAWAAIRDGNISSLIIALILFYFGTSIVKGFAFTFSIGVLLSMFTSFFITQLLLKIVANYFPNTVNKLSIIRK